MKTFRKLTKGEQQQIQAKIMADIRVIELYKTLQERPLNVLEQIMLDQILREYGVICKKNRPNYLKMCMKNTPRTTRVVQHAERKEIGAKPNLIKVGSMVWSR